MKGNKTMKKFIISLATLFLLALPNVGLSLSAQTLKDMCATDGAETNDGRGCLYFVVAAREGLLWGAQISEFRTSTDERSTSEVVRDAKVKLGVCIPEEVSGRTVLNRILDYIKLADASGNKPAALMVYDALKLAYPCE